MVKSLSFQRLLYVVIRRIVYFFFRAAGRLDIQGQENIPQKGGVIIAANHRSFADPPLIGVSTPREVHFLAKEELFRFKPFGWLIRNLNAHPLNRAGDVGAFKLAERLLSKGYALIIFPEGTRSKTDKFGKFKLGAAMLASRTGCAIVPTYVHNSAYLKQFRRLRVMFGAPLYPTLYGSYEEMIHDVMKKIQKLKEAAGQN